MKGFVDVLLDILLLFLTLSYAFSIMLLVNTTPSGKDAIAVDFAGYYFTAKTLLLGLDIYDFDIIKGVGASSGFYYEHLGFVYLPLIALLLIPLTKLSLHHAFAAWTLLNQVLLALTFLLYFKAAGKKNIGEFKINLLVFFAFTISLLFSNVVGQVTLIILFLFVLFYYAMKKGMDTLAGVSLAVSTMIKPVALIVYPYLLITGRIRVLLVALFCDAILIAVFSVAVGWGTLVNFFHKVLLPILFSNTSLESSILPIDPGIFPVLKIVLLLTPFLAIYMQRRRATENALAGGFDLEYAFLLVSVLLLTPHMSYTAYVYLIPAFWILYDNRGELLQGKVIRAVSYALPLFIAVPAVTGLTVLLSLSSIVLQWLLLLYLMFKRR